MPSAKRARKRQRKAGGASAPHCPTCGRLAVFHGDMGFCPVEHFVATLLHHSPMRRYIRV